MRFFVDADACPVKDEALRVAARHGAEISYVANAWMRLPASPLVRRVIVGGALDAADDWIAEHAGSGDIVVTADIALAARVLERSAKVVGPDGRPFTTDSIGMAMAMRSLMADLRAGGENMGGPAAFSARSRSRFLEALEQAVQDIKRGR